MTSRVYVVTVHQSSAACKLPLATPSPKRERTDYSRGIVEVDKSQIPIPHFSTTLEPGEVLR